MIYDYAIRTISTRADLDRANVVLSRLLSDLAQQYGLTLLRLDFDQSPIYDPGRPTPAAPRRDPLLPFDLDAASARRQPGIGHECWQIDARMRIGCPDADDSSVRAFVGHAGSRVLKELTFRVPIQWDAETAETTDGDYYAKRGTATTQEHRP